VEWKIQKYFYAILKDWMFKKCLSGGMEESDLAKGRVE